MGNGKRVGVAVVSMILVVGAVIGAVIGVVAVVKSRYATPPAKGSGSNHGAVETTKAVQTICASTEYKDACIRSLEGIAKNTSATPKDFVMAAVQATLTEVQKALDSIGKTVVVDKGSDEYNHVAVEDCKELLDEAISKLQSSYSMVGDSQLHTLRDRADELRSWITSVYALQSTCKDQILNQEYKSAIENGMVNATQLTHNAVNIVAELSKAFEAFNLPELASAPKARRLMGVNSYPDWFKTEDRRLLRGNKNGLTPHAVVAKDGSGQFKTVEDAINAYPKNHQGRFIIYVKAGVYDEFIVIDKKKANIMIYGDGAGKTIITGDRNYGIKKIGTMHTATFSNNAPGFIARDLTFRNTAGPEGHQAVALRITGDESAVFNCHIEGYQDTLYYHTSRQFYRDCVISGTIDFIFGMGDCIIQNSEIVVRKPLPNQFNTVTADGKEIPRGSNGLVLQNCRIVPEPALFEERTKIASYLGRPWKADALTVVMQSEIGDVIRPEGWLPWSTTDPKYFFHNTCQYFEFDNRGLGAATAGRDTRQFKNFKVIGPEEAARYTAGQFLRGHQWLPATSIPHQLGL